MGLDEGFCGDYKEGGVVDLGFQGESLLGATIEKERNICGFVWIGVLQF